MAHIHSVYDADKHFIIDPITKVIQNDSGKIKLQQHSHKSERFTFEIPRFIEGHDMSLCNKIEVHYNNIKADKTAKNKDVYKVKDMKISTDSDDIVVFSWLIKKRATQYEGSLNFCVHFACIADDGTIEYQLPTEIYSGITISETINNTETVAVDYSDVLEEWKQELEELAKGVVAWENIENKPFGETKHYDDLTYDGIIDENSVTTNTVEIYDQEICFVKVGELPATAANYIAKSDTITLGNGEHFKTKDLISHETGGSAILYEGLPLAVAINEANTIINGYEYPEAGLYLIYSKFSDGTVITVENITFKTLIPLDEKYMPESYSELTEGIEQLQENVEQLQEDMENATPSDYEEVKEAVDSNAKIISELQSKLHLPKVTAKDKGKFARVNENGEWVAETVPSFEESEF